MKVVFHNTNALKKVELFHKFLLYASFASGMRVEMKKWFVWLYYFFIISCLSFIIIGSVVTATNASTNLYKIQVTMRLLAAVITLFIPLYFAAYIDQLNRIFSNYEDSSPQYVGDEEMNILVESHFETMKLELPLHVGMALVNLVTIIFEQNKQKHSSYDVLNLYSCGSVDKKPTTWVCFNETSTIYFVVNNVFKFPLVFYQLSILVSAYWLLLTTLEGVAAKVQIYDRLTSGCAAKVNQLEKSSPEDCLQLTIVIEYQKKVIRHIREVQSATHIPNALHMTFFYVLGILVISPVVTQNHGFEYANLPLIVIACYVGYINYIISKHWMAFNSAQEHFSHTLLEFHWYERNLKFQKLYLMTLQLNQKCYPTKLFRIYEVDLKFFAANMRRLYSLLNLLMLEY